MRLFECQNCGQPLYFENVLCENCGRRLGYLASRSTLTALEPDGGQWKALADPGKPYVYCANVQYESCNWLVPAGGDSFCGACRHNRTIPNLSNEISLLRWRKVELAKHRLFYSLLRLQLPLTTKLNDPSGLAFDILDSTSQPVLTGHLNGVITINLTEADDAHREEQRGAPANWPQSFLTSYASSHPWEDFAETWAHYFHIVDTLETASAFGIRTLSQLSKGAMLSASVDFDPYQTGVDRLIEAWLPLTFAFNSINRSMGFGDLYPFFLSPINILKLSYVHEQIHRRRLRDRGSDEPALKAMIAGLKKSVPSPVNS
jgi:hypothetical protein